MSAIRVVIASTNRLLRIGLRRILDAAPDMEVISETEIDRSLLQRVKQLCPDVVLLELSTRGPEALVTLTRLFEDEQRKLVVVKPNADISCVRAMLAAGVLGYVLANSGEEELLSAIRRACRGRYFIDPQLSDAVADTLTHRQSQAGATRKPRLTTREVQVLTAISRGFTARDVAGQLQISHKTVETYRSRIYEKLGLKTRADLVAYAIATGLLISGNVGDQESA